MSDPPAVALAGAHLEAWTNHDFETVRDNLADEVQFYSPAANLVGIAEYMDAPRGLTQFASQVVPGSLRIIATRGDDRNALIMYEVSTEGGPLGSKAVSLGSDLGAGREREDQGRTNRFLRGSPGCLR